MRLIGIIKEKVKNLKEKFTKKTDTQKEIEKLAKEKDKETLKQQKKKEKQQKSKDAFMVYNLSREYKKRKKFDIHKSTEEFLEKAGVDENPGVLNRRILVFSASLTGLLILVTIIASVVLGSFFFDALLVIFLIATLVFIGIYAISFVAFFFYLDLKIYKRTKQLEEVLPDFLQLTSANISAGMPIDRALWLAVRPRFGVLAKEIEEIAKANIAGEDLNAALIKFSKKYDSRILRESINLLIAGIESGGEIGNLLNKISVNISETRLMQKEIAANVMTYVIFISVATIVAAPFLFALSSQLLSTTKQITENIDMDETSSSGSMLKFDFTNEGVKISDFNNFALMIMIFSSFFSVAIISVIRKGNVKDGLKLFPVFLAVSLVIFYISRLLFSYLMTDMI